MILVSANSGLNERDLSTFDVIFKKFPSIKLVHLFGSRAKGNYKVGSDVDLAIMNSGVDTETLAKLKGSFEESSLPYLVDVVDFTTLKNEEFREHISRVGLEFYKA